MWSSVNLLTHGKAAPLSAAKRWVKDWYSNILHFPSGSYRGRLGKNISYKTFLTALRLSRQGLLQSIRQSFCHCTQMNRPQHYDKRLLCFFRY